MGHKIALNLTTILNRLGETAVLSAFISDSHFVTILPGGELIRHTAVITKFLVEFNKDGGPGDTFFEVEESVELPLATVIVLRLEKDRDLVLDIYINSPEAPPDRPTKTIVVKPIGKPKTKINTSLAKTHAESNAIIDKLFKIVNDPSGHQVSTAALRALINGPGKGLGDTDPDPAKPDKFDQLVDMLTGGSSSPSAQVNAGTIPKPPGIVVKPSDDGSVPEGDNGGAIESTGY